MLIRISLIGTRYGGVISSTMFNLSILTCEEVVLVKGAGAGRDVRLGIEVPGISELETARLPPSTALGKGPATSLLLGYVTATHVTQDTSYSFASERFGSSVTLLEITENKTNDGSPVHLQQCRSNFSPSLAKKVE